MTDCRLLGLEQSGKRYHRHFVEFYSVYGYLLLKDPTGFTSVSEKVNSLPLVCFYFEDSLSHSCNSNMASKVLRLGVIQLRSTEDKSENLANARDKIVELVKRNCDIIVLPECFNSPYGTEYFERYAEEIPTGETSQFLKKCALEFKKFIVGGSIPEREGDNLYNTTTVWGPMGLLIGRHRKIHLFDINIPGGITFQESKTLKAGNQLGMSMFTVCGWKFGLGICYELRFEEMARLYRNKGCHVLLYPGAFNWTTGPLHWSLLLRARAVDNQVYVAGVSGACNKMASYKAWGHSSIVNPFGEIIASAGHDEEFLYADMHMSLIEKVRQQIPVFSQRRTDVYDTVEKSAM